MEFNQHTNVNNNNSKNDYINFRNKNHVSVAKMYAKQARKIEKKESKLITSTMNENKGSIKLDENEKMFQLSQKDIIDNVNIKTSNKMFNLQLDEYAPYKISYTRNGQYLALAGQKGHIGA